MCGSMLITDVRHYKVIFYFDRIEAKKHLIPDYRAHVPDKFTSDAVHLSYRLGTESCFGKVAAIIRKSIRDSVNKIP